MPNKQKLLKLLAERGIRYKQDEPLAKHTTFKIGGPADVFVEVKSKNELINAVKAAKETKIEFTILGWGSNILVSDTGVRGLIIKNSASKITKLTHKGAEEIKIQPKLIEARLKELDKDEYYTFNDLDYDESARQQVLIEIESGAPLPYTIINLIRQGITGLQWFGGIPGTMGGAIYNNIHGGSHFLSEYIKTVEILDTNSLEVRNLDNTACNFDYDYSRFHESGEIILSSVLSLHLGDKEKAQEVYFEWTKRKKKQPQISAGSVWQNISEEERKRLKLESGSWGYIIDKVLDLKGKKIGGAQISPEHAGFIVNTGNAKASDVFSLMEIIKEASINQLGIIPKREIFLVGEFNSNN